VSDAPANNLPEGLKRLIEAAGAKISTGRRIDYGTQYRVTRGAETATVNVYTSGKISTGGKPSTLLDLLEGWRLAQTDVKASVAEKPPQRTPSPDELNGTPRVGADEAGKGDYFGPLVVAGVRVSGEKAAQRLWELGVRDSKMLSGANAISLARRIVESVGLQNVRVVVLHPQEYEARRRAADNNVSKLLANINVQIFREFKGRAELFVVDEFGKAARSYIESQLSPDDVRLVVRPRAEDDLAVAAASILARARYLEEMDALSEKVGFELPRGATHVLEATQRVIEERGLKGLAEVAKVHFGTTARALEASEKAGG
jgi:ribonuclease HIII